MNFLPDVGNKEAQNKIKIDITGPVCLGNATSWHAKFTKFCRIVTTERQKSTLKISDKYLKVWLLYRRICRKNLVCKIQNGP